MALFFDVEWFDTRLGERGLSRADLAAAAGLSGGELALAFKDQREISAREVAIFAELLGEPKLEVASRCGVATPGAGPYQGRADELERRIAELQAELAALKKD